LLDRFECVFLLKVNSVFDQLLSELATVLRPIRAVYLEKIGTSEERIVTDLESLRGQKLSYFALVMIHREKTH
jgi:precorrin-2 methylase